MRAGGRVHAKTLTTHTRGATKGTKTQPLEVAADLGGSVITGVLGNPWRWWRASWGSACTK